MPGPQERHVQPAPGNARGRDRFAVRWLVLAVLAVAAALATFMLFYSRGEAEYSDEQRFCISQRWQQFDPKKLPQCLDVCKACMKGNSVTCNTSCKLKGAT
jgi:hypothetical protein